MILVPLGTSQEEKLAAVEADGMSVFTLYDGSIRGACVSATRLCAQMRANHGLGVIQGIALGQAAVCAALLSATMKDEDALSIRIDCEGPLKGLSVETRPDGSVRGRLFTDVLPLESMPESLDLAPWIGPGSLSLTRSYADGSKAFTGRIALVHSRIAEDLAEYFLKSEQTPTAFAASVKLGPHGDVLGAGGLYLQAMPGAKEEALSFVERVLAGAPSPGAWIAAGKGRRDLLVRNFLFAEIDFLAEREVRFFCPCDRDRYLGFLRSLSQKEREEALSGSPLPGNLEVVCHNCGTRYAFTASEIG